MRINTNTWNKIRYTVYSPGYDLAAGILKKSRKKSIESIKINPGNKVLIIGAGTGLDMEYLPRYCHITATDITPSMIDKINKRNKKLKRNVKTLVMDGHNLEFPENSFDFVILHLILTVIPDPVACIQETERVLKQGGQVIIFDKFIRNNKRVSLIRSVVNIFTSFLFSDITKDAQSIINTTVLIIQSDLEADFNGNFRLIKLLKE